jgi:pimeloyl-ACP methyl ester carboxylesterase/DNA-binding SARP family transcriptional activator
MFLRDTFTADEAFVYNRHMNSEATGEPLEIKLFGGLEICRNGQAIALPQSKKTRALLAYLVLKGTPQRRDALCELLWEIPDDPRGALRWSLSKLRPLVNNDHVNRLTADRERAGFERHGASVDLLELEQACAGGLRTVDRRVLHQILDRCNGELLAGLDLPHQPGYETWRLAQQERARQLKLRVLSELCSRDDVLGDARTALMRKRIELDPADDSAHADLVAHLAAIGHRSDAEAQASVSKRMLASLGIDDRRLASALKGSKSAVPASMTPPLVPATQLRQNVRFCKSVDGVQIAYATAGSGPPLVKTANWLNHLEFDWEGPVFRHLFAALTERNTLLRYDSRGNGLSDWNVENLTLDALVNDLKAVVDAAGLDRFPLFGMSQGCAVSVEFAVRWPERVSKLVLFGGYARGWRVVGNESFSAQNEAMVTLTRTGWGKDNAAYRQMFTSLFIPSAQPEEADWFNELQRITASPENAARLLSSLGNVNVSDRLALVTQPTLVMHCRHDARVPYASGRELATGIPGAKFVTLESPNHLLLEHDPAWPRFVAEIRAFLAT